MPMSSIPTFQSSIRICQCDARRDLVKFGIIDKKGNYTAPYPND